MTIHYIVMRTILYAEEKPHKDGVYAALVVTDKFIKNVSSGRVT